ncbi:MAG: aminodeoxychorismate synthase component I [Methylococcus sp.]
MKSRLQELPYFEDSAALFLPWSDRGWSVFLDSGYPHSRQGRYDILAADPVKTLVTRGPLTEIRENDSIRLSPDDPFTLVEASLGKAADPVAGLPFCGGAIGYFGYDLSRRLERLPSLAMDVEGIPDMMIGIYDWSVIVDHHERRTYLVGRKDSPALDKRWPHLVKSFSQIQTLGWRLGDFETLGKPIANLDQAGYMRAFNAIQRYIHEGDCYQVNLALRFSAAARGNPWVAYQYLRTHNPAPFSAYLNYPQAQVLSSSPERFLKVRRDEVETKPIKGTRPRLPDAVSDATQVLELRDSLKDRAENLMIVDLLRNDIGKNCIAGSVHVPRLFEIESYATVHHMVSTVRGRLRADHSALELLRGCFPGGSITGAPKIRAMEIIEELEPHRRGVYCGSVGYIGYDGSMDSNIAIRTLVHSGNTLRFWAGGGIVADSDCALEYEECHHKAAALLRLMEQFRHQTPRAHSLGY